VAKPEECQVLLQGRLPAYISWGQFTRNLKQLEANNVQVPGADPSGRISADGAAGVRTLRPADDGPLPAKWQGPPLCVQPRAGGLRRSPVPIAAGAPLDRKVGEWVLKALEPAALEVSLQVAQDREAERQQLHRHWAQRLERAR
jgi:hypothetical protein